ncbi:MAG: pyridoxal phosphate-dependent aminotransferase [Thermodesulfobacteriota bacterium]
MKQSIAAPVSRVPFSVIREMSLRAGAYKNVITLGIGEPDFHTPADISRLALQDAENGATHYTPSQGDPELLQAVLGYLRERTGQALSTKNVVVTSGGMGALNAFFRLTLESGDEVLIPEPYFPSYKPQVEWTGGIVTGVPTSFADGFMPAIQDLEKAVTSKSKVLLLNSPNNPTGAVYPDSLLEEIAAFARRHDLLVLSDEVYERLSFQEKVNRSIRSFPGMEERTVVIHSFSKSFAMTGWRIGYAFGPEWLIKPMIKVVSYYTSCASSVSQRAALACLNNQDLFFDMYDEFARRRDLICKRLAAMDQIKVSQAEGAFYVFPDISHYSRDSLSFALDLLDREQVVVVPGEAFGSDYSDCIRIAFTVNQGQLNEAMDRLQRFLAVTRNGRTRP